MTPSRTTDMIFDRHGRRKPLGRTSSRDRSDIEVEQSKRHAQRPKRLVGRENEHIYGFLDIDPRQRETRAGSLPPLARKRSDLGEAEKEMKSILKHNSLKRENRPGRIRFSFDVPQPGPEEVRRVRIKQHRDYKPWLDKSYWDTLSELDQLRILLPLSQVENEGNDDTRDIIYVRDYRIPQLEQEKMEREQTGGPSASGSTIPKKVQAPAQPTQQTLREKRREETPEAYRRQKPTRQIIKGPDGKSTKGKESSGLNGIFERLRGKKK